MSAGIDAGNLETRVLTSEFRTLLRLESRRWRTECMFEGLQIKFIYHIESSAVVTPELIGAAREDAVREVVLRVADAVELVGEVEGLRASDP